MRRRRLGLGNGTPGLHRRTSPPPEDDIDVTENTEDTDGYGFDGLWTSSHAENRSPNRVCFQRGTSRLLKEARGATYRRGEMWTNQRENTEHTKPERTTEKTTSLINKSTRKDIELRQVKARELLTTAQDTSVYRQVTGLKQGKPDTSNATIRPKNAAEIIEKGRSNHDINREEIH